MSEKENIEETQEVEIVDALDWVEPETEKLKMCFFINWVFQFIWEDQDWDDLKVPVDDFDMTKSLYDISEWEDWEIIYTKSDRFIEYEAKTKQEAFESSVKQINEDFDKTVDEYLSKYPKREQDTFSEKKREAEKVLLWESSVYIEWKATALGITPQQFAAIIIQKNTEWTQKYTGLENEKDLKIAQLEAQLLS